MPRINLEIWKGDWIVVTGASSGIGEAFCHALAAKGLNLVLVARRQERLVALANTLRERHGIQTLVFAADLSQTGVARRLREQLDAGGIRPRGLINNAGAGLWGEFSRHPAQAHEAIVQVVAAAPMALCAEFLPSLRGYPESLIVNVSSPAAYQPVPYMASYAAAKTALQHFSLALYQELKGTGVLVQTLVPAPSQTEFDDRAGAYQSGVGDVRRPPEEVVAACLANLDTERPLAGNAKGLYKQRMFAGLFPVRTVLAMVAKMFKPPADG